MKIFLDTSSLFKLYHKETGTIELENLFSTSKISAIFLSEITKIEFTSTVWKKIRTKEISDKKGQTTLGLFDADCEKYTFVTTDSIIVEQARVLTSKYGHEGLRTLDSIQLSTAVSLVHLADIFITADQLLNSLFLAEGLSVEMSD